MFDVKDVLQSIGYKVYNKTNGYYRTCALYRGGKNPTSLSIDAENGRYTDFASGESGTFLELISRTLNISERAAAKYLNLSEIDAEEHKKEYNLELPITFNSNEIKSLLPSYSFYKKRGISECLLKMTGGGICTHGRMYDRFVFPIYNVHNRLVGLAGRDVTENERRPKWKNLGKTNQWDYPAIFSVDSIKNSGTLIIVESIGDWLALASNDITNVLISFGLKISDAMLKVILGCAPNKILIATNNDDTQDENHGQLAAKRMIKKLSSYFSVNNIMITPPLTNDFGDMTGQQIAEWKEKFLTPIHI